MKHFELYYRSAVRLSGTTSTSTLSSALCTITSTFPSIYRLSKCNNVIIVGGLFRYSTYVWRQLQVQQQQQQRQQQQLRKFATCGTRQLQQQHHGSIAVALMSSITLCRRLFPFHHPYVEYNKSKGNSTSGQLCRTMRMSSTVVLSAQSSSTLSHLMKPSQTRYFHSTISSNDYDSANCFHYYNRIRILYASQTGTAQLFAQQLEEGIVGTLEEDSTHHINNNDSIRQQVLQSDDVTVSELSEIHPKELFQIPSVSLSSSNDAIMTSSSSLSSPTVAVVPTTLHIFIVSTAGVGEPPENGKSFYDELLKLVPTKSTISEMVDGDKESFFPYCLFALGNSKAHPNNFCAFGKNLQSALEQQQQLQLQQQQQNYSNNHHGSRIVQVLPTVFGDDAGAVCLEDAFDQFQNDIIQHIITMNNTNRSDVQTTTSNDTTSHPNTDNNDTIIRTATGGPGIPCLSSSSQTSDPKHVGDSIVVLSTSSSGKKYPSLELKYTVPGSQDHISTDTTYDGLLDIAPSLYQSGGSTPPRRVPVLSNKVLNPNNPSVTALRELILDISTSNDSTVSYETGDHLVLYPCNSDVIVDAYLSTIHPPILDPHNTIIMGSNDDSYSNTTASTGTNDNITKKKGSSYPHPLNISIYDTLRYCVDLGALPSPAFTRYLLGIENATSSSATDSTTTRMEVSSMDYTRDIAHGRRTVLDLLLLQNSTITNNNTNATGGRKLTLECLLYNLPPIKPRYYSIASCADVHKDKVYITYRPIKYVTKFGLLREGLATSYMSSLCPTTGVSPTTVTCAIRSNPTFRLPKPPVTTADRKHGLQTTDMASALQLTPPPILLIAGGCGVAPIRAFLEELIYRHKLNRDDNYNSKDDIKERIVYGPVHLFLGFRHPADEVYKELVEEASELGILQTKIITYNIGSVLEHHNIGLVSDAVVQHGNLIYWLLTKERCVTYLCGGARTFGAAIEHAMQHILQEGGGGKAGQELTSLANDENNDRMNEVEAAEFIRSLIRTGRLHEDLSD